MEEETRTLMYDYEYAVTNFGGVYKVGETTTKKLKPRQRRGKNCVILRANKNRMTVAVDSLVASLFVPNEEGFKSVRHLDGNLLNDRADNLEWCKRERRASKSHGHAKLTDDEAREVRSSYTKRSGTKLAEKYGITRQAINKIVRGESYKWVE